MRATLPFGIALLLAACGHVPLSSFNELRKLDVMTVDATQLRVAVVTPPELRVPRNSAVIVAGIRESADQPGIEETFVLKELSAVDNSNNLPQRAQIFRISAADLPRLDAFRAIVQQRKEESPNGTKGYLTVTSGACVKAPLPSGPLPVDTFLQTHRNDPFFVLTRAVDLRRLKHSGDLISSIPACD